MSNVINHLIFRSPEQSYGFKKMNNLHNYKDSMETNQYINYLIIELLDILDNDSPTQQELDEIETMLRLYVSRTIADKKNTA